MAQLQPSLSDSQEKWEDEDEQRGKKEKHSQLDQEIGYQLCPAAQLYCT